MALTILWDMSESSEATSRCPVPHVGASPSDTPSPLSAEETNGAASGCPVPSSMWGGELREAVAAKARAAADASGLATDRAEKMAQAVVEQRATSRRAPEITQAFVAQLEKKLGYGHPLSDKTGSIEFTWTPEALARLDAVPDFCRELTKWRVEWTAAKKDLGTTITPEIMDVKYDMWGKVSHAIEERRDDGAIPWTDAAKARFDAIPSFVKGQVLEAVEGNAALWGVKEIDNDIIDKVIDRWVSTGDFHEGLYGFK